MRRRTINAERASIQSALQQLDLALQRHNQWYDAVIRTLVCDLPGEPDDVAPDAHHRCPFGRWYYEDAPAVLHRHPGFAAIEEQHERMHGLAAKLLGSLGNGQSVSVTDFDAFARELENLRLEIFTLRRDLENALYSLDELTGAGNRIGMLGVLREQQARVDRAVQSCCVVMIDIDHFKHVNDTYGHAMGDEVLRNIGKMLKESLRTTDLASRYGGEELTLLLPHTDLTAAIQVADTLRQRFAEWDHVHDGVTIRKTASMGVAAGDGKEEVPGPEDLLKAADEALYQAKEGGRNRVVAAQ